MIIISEKPLSPYPKLLNYLKNELPKVVDNKPVFNAYIIIAATNGKVRKIPQELSTTDGRIVQFTLAGKMALRPGGGPSAHVAMLAPRFDNAGKKVVPVDGATLSSVNSTTFNIRLIKGLEAMSNLKSVHAALELVALHELTHWLHDRGAANPEKEIGELGDVFEEVAYSAVELRNRQEVIDNAYKRAAGTH